MKRIFISIPLSPELRQDIAGFQTRFPNLLVRWLKPENLHITLVPPIEVNEDRLAEIKSQLTHVSGHSPFPISFQEVMFGPNDNDPRLIWARGEAPAEMVQLKENIEQAIGYQPDRPNFTMHATLARFREKDFENFPIQTFNEPVHWKMLVEEFVIMESVRLPSGAHYPILKTFPLL